MADLRVCHQRHEGAVSAKFSHRIPSASVPRRGRSRLRRRRRQLVKAFADTPEENSVILELDLRTKISENPTTERVKPTVPANNTSFNWTAWKSHALVKIEPIKCALSELDYMLVKAIPDSKANGARKSLGKGTVPTSKGTVTSPFHLSSMDREKLYSWISQMQSDSEKNGVDSSVTCEVLSNDGNVMAFPENTNVDPESASSIARSDTTMETSVPCGEIKSGKSPVISREDSDSQLVVVIPFMDANGEQKEGCKRWLRRKKKTIEGPKLDKYLDTNVIDRYMEQLWNELPEDKQESCTYLDCLWFSMYLEDALSFDILKWTKAKRIFSKQYVFIPIVHWSHWNLLILCHFGEGFTSRTRTPCMLLLDSLKETDPKRLEPLIRRFIMEVHKLEGRQESEKVISSIPFLVPEVPQQTNGNDCGVFLLHFVDLFLKSAPENFSTFEGYPYFLTKDWFKSRDIAKRRRHILDICLNEEDYASQKINKRISTRTKRLHSFVNGDRMSNWIDLSSAA